MTYSDLLYRFCSNFAAKSGIVRRQQWHFLFSEKFPQENGPFRPVFRQNYVLHYLMIRSQDFFEFLQLNKVLWEDKSDMFVIS